MIAAQVWTCDWCETRSEYEGEEAEERAREDGWFALVTPTAEKCFCSVDCLVSSL